MADEKDTAGTNTATKDAPEKTNGPETPEQRAARVVDQLEMILKQNNCEIVGVLRSETVRPDYVVTRHEGWMVRPL